MAGDRACAARQPQHRAADRHRARPRPRAAAHRASGAAEHRPPVQAGRLPRADRRAAQDLPGHHRAAGLRELAREGLRRRLHRGEGAGAPDPAEAGSQAEPRDPAARPRGDGRVRLVAVSDRLHARAAHGAAGLQLHAALVDPEVLRLPRGQRAAPADGRPRARLRALRGCGAPVQVRQPEAGGAALGGQPAHLQPALHRLRHLLRVSRRGLSPQSPERETQGRAQLLGARPQLPERANLPRLRRPQGPASSSTGWTPSPTCAPSSA